MLLNYEPRAFMSAQRHAVRRARTMIEHGTLLAARPHQLKLEVTVGHREELIDWLGKFLWHWEGGPISSDTLAEEIMEVWDAQQKHASQLSAPSLPNAQETLRELRTSLSRTEIPLPRECQDERQGE